MSIQGERAIRHEYDPVTNLWSKQTVNVLLDTEPFAEGAMRVAYHCSIMQPGNQSFVAKFSKEGGDPRDIYFKEAQMQMVAKFWAAEFNKRKPPKMVDFLTAWVLEFVDRPGRPLAALENFVTGVYEKHNNNLGRVSDVERNTPQAFSHFTYEASRHKILICDIQGVADMYTDPQIHSASGVGFGRGNLGMMGIRAFFMRHRCNMICAYLGLPITQVRKDDMGTMPSNAARLAIRTALAAAAQANGNSSSGSGSPTSPSRSPLIPTIEELSPSRNTPPSKLSPTIANNISPTARQQEEIDQVAARKLFTTKAFSRGRLLTGSVDKAIKVWDLETKECVNTLKGHADWINCLQFVRKDDFGRALVFSASGDCTVKVWVEDKAVAYTRSEEPVVSMCASGHYLFAGCTKNLVKVWDTSTIDKGVMRCWVTLEAHDGGVKCLDVCNDGSRKLLVTASTDETIKVWSWARMEEEGSLAPVATLKGHSDAVNCLVIIGRRLFTGSGDETIKVWDLDRLVCTNTLESASLWVNCMTWDPDQNRLYTGAGDGTIKVWDIDTLKLVGTLRGHQGPVYCMECKRDMLFSGSYDKQIKVWNTKTMELVSTLKGHDGPVYCLAVLS